MYWRSYSSHPRYLGAHQHSAEWRIQWRKAALDSANHPAAADWLHHLAASGAGRTACEALTLSGLPTDKASKKFWGSSSRVREACKLGCEVIVSKRLGSIYRRGRSLHWVKVKNPNAPAVTREVEEDWGR